MNRSFIITNLSLYERDYQVLAEYNTKGLLMDISCEQLGCSSILGNIYIGRVRDIVPNLNAAFIDIGGQQICYYSMEDLHHPVFTHKIGKKPLCEGDELLVQVTKEAVKTKYPVVTTNISFTGNYLVLTSGNQRLGISSKLNKALREDLKKTLKPELEGENFGIIVRTNAAAASSASIQLELEGLKTEYERLTTTAVHKTFGSCLRAADPFYIRELRSKHLDTTDTILTDDAAVYQLIPQFLARKEDDAKQLRLYEDTSYPLSKLYPIKHHIEECIKERVWLKSGAYLIISPTEALTVIDVNSGKNTVKKNPQENFLRINIEAAREIARQLRIRNISGICIVDFINLKEQQAMETLLGAFREAVADDPVSVKIVDITKLGLVELTRRKEKASLAEQLQLTNL